MIDGHSASCLDVAAEKDAKKKALTGTLGKLWPIAFGHMPPTPSTSTGTPSGAWPKIGRLAALRSCSKLIQVGRSAHFRQSACVGYQPSRTPAARTSALTESSTSGS